MTQDEILDKAAAAMHESFSPVAPRDSRWVDRQRRMYRVRFKVGLAAVEDDIRRDERNRVTAWLREVADKTERNELPRTAIPMTLRALADTLDRRPIEDAT